MERMPKAGEFYRHVTNKLYQVAGVAEHTGTGEKLVVFQALYGDFRLYAEPLSQFNREVDHEKYPEAGQQYQFEQVVFVSRPAVRQDVPHNGEAKPDDSQRVPYGQQAEPAETEEMDGQQVNPWLLRFLEADGYEKQLEVLNQMQGKIGQKELESIYLVLDISPMGGDTDSQLRRIMSHLETRMRYDGSRLRRGRF